MKTANKKLVLQRARLLREAVITEDFESLARMRQRSDFVKIGDVVRAYLAYPALQCSEKTARANARALCLVLRKVYPGQKPEGEVGKVRAKSAKYPKKSSKQI